MDRKVSDIGEQLMALESRLETLENARSMSQVSNARHNELGEIRDCVPVINSFKKKYKVLDQLSVRIK